MKALVTGAGGFAGVHLVQRLLAEGHVVVATGLAAPSGLAADAETRALDVTDAQACWNVLTDTRPDAVFHLAAVAHVARAEQDPDACLAVNLGGTRNMLEACLDGHARTRFLLVSSAEVYGRVAPAAVPVTEDQPLRPGTIYAVSKACAEMALHHAVARGLHGMVARAFNHIGPGQSPDYVAAAFARLVARIEAGDQEPVVRVGNLAAVRDFSDVRVVVEGYLRIVEHGDPGDVFNVTSGAAEPVQAILDTLIELSGHDITVEQDAGRLRPLDVPVFHGSGARLTERCGFDPSFDRTAALADVLDYWRATVRREPVR